MSENVDTTELKKNIDIVAFIGKYVALESHGPHYLGLCPFHNENTPSFKVTPKKNIFKCFGCGASGDVIAFLTKMGRSFPEAIKELSDPNNTAAIGLGEIEKNKSKKKVQAAVWRQIVPAVPSGNMFFHYKYGNPSMTWPYHDENGSLVGYVCRFDLPDGKKEVYPYIYATNGTRKEWRWLGFEKPRPIYDLHIIEKKPTRSVILVEGEKTAEAVKLLFPKTNVTTWIGGANGIKATNFSPLRGRSVIFWPDNDQVGFDAMLDINDIIKGYCAETKWIINPVGSPKGWDAADSEWTHEDARAHTSKNTISVPERGSDYATFKLPVLESPKHTIIEEIVKPEEKKVIEVPPLKPSVPLLPPNDDPGAAYPLKGSEFFKILGAMKDGNGMLYNFYSMTAKTVISLTPGGMTKNNLLQLAPLDWWKNTFPDKHGFSLDDSADYLINKSSEKGIFNKRLIRGRGAWIDEKRVFMHVGDRIFIDGKETSLKDYKSKYIYEIGVELGFDLVKPNKNQDGIKLLDMLSLINWERSVNMYLFAGWCVLAPVCGALKWRPHIWLTGPAGSGKTFVFTDILKALLGESALYVEGESTAPGLRKFLNNDALPIVFEEAEGENRQSQERMQSVLALMRSSSSNTGNVIVKGGSGGGAPDVYQLGSCFAFASIGIQAAQQSDKSRLSILGIIKALDPEADSRYQKLLKAHAEIITDEFSMAFRSRTISLLPIILENIKTFSKAAAAVIGTQRTGDQIGVLVAGAYSLESDKIISFDDAVKWLADKDWKEEKSNDSMGDEVRLVSHLLQQMVRINGEFTTHERTTGELVQTAMNLRNEWSFSPDKANDRLKRLGMKVVDDWLYISNSDDQIKRILYNTPWTNNHNKILMRLAGAESVDSFRFASGVTTRAVRLPKDLLFKDMEPVTIEKELSASESLTRQSEIQARAVKQLGLGIKEGEDYPF